MNGDGYLTPMDVLILINSINQDGNRELPVPTKAPNSPPPFYDVNGNNRLTPADVLIAINEINSRAAGGGEGEPGDDSWFA